MSQRAKKMLFLYPNCVKNFFKRNLENGTENEWMDGNIFWKFNEPKKKLLRNQIRNICQNMKTFL
jgi:hypothetical protein